MAIPRPFQSGSLAVAALLSLLSHPACAGTGGDDRSIGDRVRHVAPAAGAYPAVGCWDHRALMFIVREMGTDPGAARQLAERDCQPLVPEGAYLRCGPGGSTFPAEGGERSYSAYCRIGASDIQLYALDEMMLPEANPAQR